MVRTGVIIGLIFCLISAIFDVYVAFMTQAISTLLVMFYCFTASAIFLLHAPSVVAQIFYVQKLLNIGSWSQRSIFQCYSTGAACFMRCATWSLP